MKPWGLCGSGILGMGHAKSCSLATASVQGSHLPGPSSGGSWGARQPHRFWLVEQHRQCFLPAPAASSSAALLRSQIGRAHV